MGIFLDIQKAFYCVNRALLLKKLKYSGIRGVANDLLKSFLNYKNQRIKIDDYYSETRGITCGVL